MDFPLLKTGAVLQYPGRRELSFSTTVIRFVDGSEQRFRQQGSGRRRWVIKIQLLSEDELRRIRDFFLQQAGQAHEFTFQDPWDGAEYEHCVLTGDSYKAVLTAMEQGETELVIEEIPEGV